MSSQKLKGCDVRFLKEKMELYINSSKTDQYRQGASILIARTGLTTCPVGMVERYVAAGNVDLGSEERLFRAICVTKNGESLRVSGSLSYTRMREIVLAKLRELGYDAKKFGLHSFRAGGGGIGGSKRPRHIGEALQEARAVEVRVSQGRICQGFRGESA